MAKRFGLGMTAVVLVLGAGACASNVSTPESLRAGASQTGGSSSVTSFESVKAAVEFESDQHMGTRTATGPEVKYLDPRRNKWVDGYAIYHIRAFDVGRSGPDTIDFTDVQIRVRQMTYGDWPHYETAYSEGERFEVTRIDSDVSCIGASTCSKTEVIGIDMTMEQLRALAQRPILAFKVVGNGNSMLVEIAQSYVQGLLSAVDEISTQAGSSLAQ